MASSCSSRVGAGHLRMGGKGWDLAPPPSILCPGDRPSRIRHATPLERLGALQDQIICFVFRLEGKEKRTQEEEASLGALQVGPAIAAAAAAAATTTGKRKLGQSISVPPHKILCEAQKVAACS